MYERNDTRPVSPESIETYRGESLESLHLNNFTG